MTKWPLFTILPYAILVAVVITPATIAFTMGAANDAFVFPDYFVTACSNMCVIYAEWGFWIFCGVILLIESMLLLVPVKSPTDRPRPRRHVWFMVLTTSLLFSILLLCMITSIGLAIFGDGFMSDAFGWFFFGFIPVAWIFWSYLFFRIVKKTGPDLFCKQSVKLLIKGSILELLIAVPSHIIVRRRDDCCAPGMTVLGMACGIVIMFIAFGPGLYFLFRDRFEKMQPTVAGDVEADSD